MPPYQLKALAGPSWSLRSGEVPMMSERLGNALYSIGCVFGGAFLVVGIGAAAFLQGSDRYTAGAVFAAVGVVTWLIGRACQYVPAGT